MSRLPVQALATVLLAAVAGIPLPAMDRPAASAPAAPDPAGLPAAHGAPTLVRCLNPKTGVAGFRSIQGRAILEWFPSGEDWSSITVHIAGHQFGTHYHRTNGLKYERVTPLGDSFLADVGKNLPEVLAEFWKEVEGVPAVHPDLQRLMGEFPGFIDFLGAGEAGATSHPAAVWRAFQDGYLASAASGRTPAAAAPPSAPAVRKESRGALARKVVNTIGSPVPEHKAFEGAVKPMVAVRKGPAGPAAGAKENQSPALAGELP